MHSRRWILAGLLASAAVPGCAEAPSHSPRPAMKPGAGGAEAIVHAAGLGGTVGFVVMDSASGKVLEAMNENSGQPPASVAKAMTTLYALDRLGPNYRYATRVMATGPVQNGQLQGDLILVGSGDPSLDTDRLGDLAQTLAARGIKEVTGRYLAFAGGIPHIDEIDRDQPDHVGYNPAVAGLNLNYNRVNFKWQRGGKGYALSMDARGKRYVPSVSMSNVAAVARKSPLFTYKRGQDRDHWTVAQSALGKNGSRWLPVRHPEAYTAEVFATLMHAHGLRLPAVRFVTALPAGVVLAETRSDALTDLTQAMLKYSTNLTAEAVGLTASGASGLRQSGAQMQAWAAAQHGIGCKFVDHSGLSGDSRITAADMAGALQRSRGGLLPGLLREQGLRDATGKEVKDHPTRVLAKTGTLNFVSGLAGYIRPPSGQGLTFAIFSADTRRRNALSMAEREQPPGGRQWTRNARDMQAHLIRHWAAKFT
ncbi:D-alanyl-D-alanine carboxypeptidase/D-alanyl-D-alanine-endopeptidase (plasmid) [Pseudorhodobacter turbinis]|uniref:D-alanyl-D-alanine carboxypeptidase/D-alanyl-D-alanine-endopeptidase n=1 Tax=Pseudorhodobacter turbinis TaxID=2500533 RepID=A0A4P8EHH1_9RHOB|nr:D-alanyl-D-alanine carboxypeptidase/D-alanyl-D-alanine-endopeptidase [Pseudorhodobacter turbinis]QCO56620.1 D-alanyl-D-alanine carboxypeptidase/D-alanyl-D-alanine-endopeptidase [Pseudorhodobacter turbinis]